MGNTSPVAAGQTIANKYLVEGVLGEGGMGVVVAAWHLGLDQRVAIKLLLRERLQHDSSALERFQREARVAARIRSEHVCRVLDTGALDDGTPFLVMEYLEGNDLADELTQRGRLPVAEAVSWLCQACDALQKAHEAGIVHRDLKPANLFLQRRADGTRILKVLDFGVSKAFGRAGASHRPLTKTASVVGSPIYMSPEQLNSSKDVDGRTDVWALGTILYELISGRTPFFGDSLPQLVSSVLHNNPEPFQAFGIMVPAGLEEAMLRALRKSRDERYGGPEQFARALAPFAPSAQVSISHTVMVASRPPPLLDESMSAAANSGAANGADRETGARPSQRGGSRRAALALLALVIAGGLLLLVLSRRSGTGQPPLGASTTLLPSERDAGPAPEAAGASQPASAGAPAVVEASADVRAATTPDLSLGPSTPSAPVAAEHGNENVRSGAAAPKPAVNARRDSPGRHTSRAESVAGDVSGVTDFGGRH